MSLSDSKTISKLKHYYLNDLNFRSKMSSIDDYCDSFQKRDVLYNEIIIKYCDLNLRWATFCYFIRGLIDNAYVYNSCGCSSCKECKELDLFLSVGKELSKFRPSPSSK